MERRCDNCEKDLPVGCSHFYGNQKGCKVGKRNDKAWTVGLALYRDISDRRGLKQVLDSLDEEMRARLIDTWGNLAVASVKLADRSA